MAKDSKAGSFTEVEFKGDGNENENEEKKRRGPNWSRDEETALVNAVAPYYSELFGAHSAKLDEKRKKVLWSVVTNTVNASSSVRRDAKSLKKKWTKLKSETKCKAAVAMRSRKRTGGGETYDEDLDDFEERVVSLGESSSKIAKLMGVTSVVGVFGGFDSFRKSESEVVKILTPTDNIIPIGTADNIQLVVHGPSPSTSTTPLTTEPVCNPLRSDGPKIVGGTNRNPKSGANKIGPEMLAIQEKILSEISSLVPIMSRIADALESIANK